MDKQEKDEIIEKFPPEFRRAYFQALKTTKNPHKKPAITPPIKPFNTGKYVAKLVERVAPNTVLGRPLSPQERINRGRFIKMEVEKAEISQPLVIEGSQLVVDGWQSYHSLVKESSELMKEQEVKSFVSLVDSIPGACGCVKGALNQAAEGSYAQMLPILHARVPDFFDIIKRLKNVQKVTFKEKDVVLLEV